VRDEARLLGESSDDGMADTLCEGWRCPNAGHTPYATPDDMPNTPFRPLRRIAERAAKVVGTPPHRTCPFAAVYGTSHPIVTRALHARALMEDGLTPRDAFPGGVTAADRHALIVLRAGTMARQRSEDAARERERKDREAAEAAKPR